MLWVNDTVMYFPLPKGKERFLSLKKQKAESKL